jgi:hypothetical protein
MTVYSDGGGVVPKGVWADVATIKIKTTIQFIDWCRIDLTIGINFR